MRDALGGTILLLFGLVTALLSLQLPIGTFRAPGSGLFPLILGLTLLALAAAYLVQLRMTRHGRPSAPAPPAGPASLSRVLAFVAAVAAAAALLAPLGYPLVAFLLLAALLRILGLRPWWTTAAVALGAAAASYVLFVRWLQIPLPRGWLGL
ncbi:MAG: tripartite tricarboxylate transporter TctB family protein [Candidatus Methylomirabilales bacterium]